jgi:hypothetical protein
MTQKSFWEGIKDGFEEGYKKQDAVIQSDKEKFSPKNRATDAAISGLVEGILNPVRWIGSILR